MGGLGWARLFGPGEAGSLRQSRQGYLGQSPPFTPATAHPEARGERLQKIQKGKALPAAGQ